MKSIKILLTQLFAILVLPTFLAQSPNQDLNWETKWIDNFNNPILGSNWIMANNAVHADEPQLYLSSNVSLMNGKLILNTNNIPTTCPQNPTGTTYACGVCIPNQIYNYTSAWVETSNLKKFKYGFIESEIELPQGNGLWPAFWTWQNNSPFNPNYVGENEIDIFEALLNSVQPNRIGSNLHTDYCPSNSTMIDCETVNYLTPICPQYDSTILCFGLEYENFNFDIPHKYGLEWNSNKISWYIDDNIVRVTNNPGINDSVRLIFNTAISTDNLPNSSNVFPTTMKVNYVKYYQLKKSCALNFNSCSFNNFDFRVYNEIQIGGLNCQNTLNNYNNYILRTLNGLIVNGDFIVPNGITLEVKLQNCNE